MLFQPLDENKFVGLYANGKIHRELPDGMTGTWRFCDHMSELDLTYASLYCGGKSLSEVCPPELLVRWQHASEGMSAHITACRVSKVDLNSYSFLELVPPRLLTEFLELKNKITEHVLNTYPKPTNYNFLHSLERLVGKIGKNKLNINLNSLKPHLTTVRARSAYKRIQAARPVIDYDPHKTKTGRLTSKKGGFPILILDKQYRVAIEPNNDLFLELDFNAAELRTLLALSGKEQPQEDIHEWNAKHVYKGGITRDEAKKRIFAWLYNPASKDKASASAYDRAHILEQHYDGQAVNTCFGRRIEADQHHALNYIIQSTTSDLLLKRAIKIDKMLETKKSNIAFTLHDSLVIDLSLEDKGMMRELIKIFGATDLGEYVVNVSAGKNFGQMKAVNL